MHSRTEEVIEARVVEVIDTKDVPIDGLKDDELPAYSIAKAIAYARDPKNADQIQAFADDAATGYKRVVSAIDEGVTRTKDLFVDLLEDEGEEDGILSKFTSSLLSDLTGIR